jgi:hypothetical protein
MYLSVQDNPRIFDELLFALTMRKVLNHLLEVSHVKQEII